MSKKKTLLINEFLEKVNAGGISVQPYQQIIGKDGKTKIVAIDCSGCNNSSIVIDGVFNPRYKKC